ncbi:MAG: type I secretion system permease/ATPase [Granulosicoccus sp.]|nr:type I secretion system permease/ATPase [Granulosicoccus sp.]
MKRGKADRPALNPYLLDVVDTFRPAIIAVFTFSFFINLLSVAVPLYMLQIYAKVLPSRNVDTLFIITGIVLVSIAVLAMLDANRRTILSKVAILFDNRLSDHLLNSAIHRAVKRSDTSINVMSDLRSVRSFLAGSSALPLLDLPWTPLFLACLFLLHPLLGYVGLAGAIVMLLLAVLNEKLTNTPVREANQESRDMIDHARVYVRNADVVQAMGMQPDILNRWRRRNAKALGASFSAGRITTRLASLSKLIRLLLQIGIICTAAWLIIDKQLTAGVTIASVLLMRRAISPMEQAIRSWKSIISARGALQNISEYLNHASSLESDSEMPLPVGTMSTHKLRYRRSGDEHSIINRVDMTVLPGKITVLTGPMAGGKSTLLKLLAGVVPPSAGSVRLNGFELDRWSAEQLGPYIGYLPQSVCLFPVTVRENISRLSDAPIEEVVSAAESVGVHTMIQHLPKGYDTIINEDSTNLSGGQRQRIGLARAVFGTPSVLLLDEPDASLDEEGRSILRATLRKLRESNIAILVVSHRRSTIKCADVLYELADGKIKQVETGKSDAADGGQSKIASISQHKAMREARRLLVNGESQTLPSRSSEKPRLLTHDGGNAVDGAGAIDEVSALDGASAHENVDEDDTRKLNGFSHGFDSSIDRAASSGTRPPLHDTAIVGETQSAHHDVLHAIHLEKADTTPARKSLNRKRRRYEGRKFNPDPHP